MDFRVRQWWRMVDPIAGEQEAARAGQGGGGEWRCAGLRVEEDEKEKNI